VDRDDTAFDADSLRLREPLPDAKARRRSREFVMISLAQSEQLDKAVNFATERIFRHLLFLVWRSRDNSVRLANAALLQKGIHRKAKWRALAELETLGLINVERRSRKSPQITVLETGVS
jgi:hypothetical protein